MAQAVLYAAKSTDDKHGSIPTQLDDARRLAKRDGFEVVAEFSDEAASAFKGNRGPGLAQALAKAEELGAALIVQHSDRLARGDGSQAQHLVELVLRARKAGVRLVSVQDPQTFDGMGLVYAALMGDRAHEDSARKSKATRAGKQRQLDRGEHLGGPVCDGYRQVAQHDDSGRVVGRTFALDPDRAPVVRAMFDLAAEGAPDARIARSLNAQGHRTRHGRPFTRRAVQNAITNPFYAGGVAYKRGTPEERIVEGRHPALVEQATFDRIQAMRAARDLAEPGQKRTGRPAQNHALARLAVCGRCGEGMYAVTSSYRRKDGSRARSYVCPAYHASTGTCDAKPIDAEAVDAAVIAGLDSLLVDFESWRQRIEDSHAADRSHLAGEVARAVKARDQQAVKAEKVEAKWSEYVTAGDDGKADLVLPMVEKERQALVEADRRLTAAQDALASIPTETSADAMLDFANALRESVRGRVDPTGTMAEVNEALRELFVSFWLFETPGDGPFAGVAVVPYLRDGVIAPEDEWAPVVRAGAEPPPLRWLHPERNVQDSHA
jgi:site-specific DNA recombinase